jgi:hypothetical protein
MNLNRKISVVMVALGSVSVAQAELIDRGEGFIYDTVLNITWTQDVGHNTWYEQDAWVQGLSLTHNGTVYDDWRLPNMDVNGDSVLVYCSTATELECRDNELGYMFFKNGISGNSPGPFTSVGNLQWSSTDYDAEGRTCSGCAWRQGFDNDSHNYVNKSYNGYSAWAVRDGDVLLTEPVTIEIQTGKKTDCKGTVGVAIFGSVNLDVSDIDQSTLSFDGLVVSGKRNGTLSCAYEDSNSDGYTDLVCKYQNSTKLAFLTGEFVDGTEIEGADAYCVF